MVYPGAFLLGVISLLLLPAVPPRTAVVAVASVTLAALVLCRRHVAAGAVAAAGAGFLLAAAHASEYLESRWPANRTDERVLAEVVVDTIPVADYGGWSFDADVRVLAPQSWQRNLTVRLVSRDPAVRPHSGERWQMVLALRPPAGRLNPGSPDIELQYFRERIHATGRVVPSALNRRLDAGHRPLTALRERIVERIAQRVADRDAAALISALAVGAVGEISREQWRVFNATGTTHLVAISGLHVTLFAVVAFAVARWVWFVAAWRMAPWTRDGFAAFVGLAAATGYALLAGFSVPTQRTLVMLAAWVLARMTARECRPMTPLGIAVFGVVGLDPFAPLFAGFWLSFAAMGVILVVTRSRIVTRSMLSEAVNVQLAVSLALAPLTLAWFGSVSLIGPLVNVVAIPAVSWVFVPLVLLAVTLMPWASDASAALLRLAAGLHEAVWPLLVRLADLPFAVAHADPPAVWYVVAFCGIGLSLMPLPASLRLGPTAVAALLAATGTTSPPPFAGLSIAVLDVGQGRAVVVQTARHVLVYDTGEVYGSGGRIVDGTLIPFLRSRGIRRIDTLVLSWSTEENAMGLTALLAQLPVREVILGSGDPDFPGARRCVAGDSWDVDGAVFEVLHPDARSLTMEGMRSCVLRVTTPGGRLLLPGDVDASTERELARTRSIEADVVVVPRRGSDTASSPEFIRAVKARLAIVSGPGTSPGRDRPAIARWQASGAQVLVTGEAGAILVTIDPETGLAPAYASRTARRALWRASP